MNKSIYQDELNKTINLIGYRSEEQKVFNPGCMMYHIFDIVILGQIKINNEFVFDDDLIQ